MALPVPLRALFDIFPLYQFPPIPIPAVNRADRPTLWILPPRNIDTVLSSDVECLRWQAFLALRGVTDIALRWDISPEGAIDRRLPNILIPAIADADSQLWPANQIAAWVEERHNSGVHQGYQDEAAQDESHAWVSLLEGPVRAALTLSQPPPSLLSSLCSLEHHPEQHIETLLVPPPAPLFGLHTIIPSLGSQIPSENIHSRYTEAMSALSERLGTDRWFLGSEAPTALDALVFAHLHSILHAKDSIRIEVTRRVNLVTWERRVRAQVQAAFKNAS